MITFTRISITLFPFVFTLAVIFTIISVFLSKYRSSFTEKEEEYKSQKEADIVLLQNSWLYSDLKRIMSKLEKKVPDYRTFLSKNKGGYIFEYVPGVYVNLKSKNIIEVKLHKNYYKKNLLTNEIIYNKIRRSSRPFRFKKFIVFHWDKNDFKDFKVNKNVDLIKIKDNDKLDVDKIIKNFKFNLKIKNF